MAVRMSAFQLAQACWKSRDDAAAERRRLYMRRLKDKAAAMASKPGSRQIVTNETHRMKAIGGQV
jgi:hypothetical protein